ncbi:MAG: hypothetical protein L0216_17830 [Planctomycetales bacterium]|nr:hypothetical protein [Planctomycetales bacterium]
MLLLLVLVGAISTISSWLGKLAKGRREGRSQESPGAAAAAMAEVEKALPGFGLAAEEEETAEPEESSVEPPRVPAAPHRPAAPAAARSRAVGLADLRRMLEEAARAAGLAPLAPAPEPAPAPAPEADSPGGEPADEGEEGELPFIHPSIPARLPVSAPPALPRALGGGPLDRAATSRGVLWAEVLGAPRCRRPWRPGGGGLLRGPRP